MRLPFAKCFLFASVLTMMVFGFSHAVEIEGVSFDSKQYAGDHLVALRGTGLLRYMAFIKVYVAAFYMPEEVSSVHALSDTPKRLEINYFQAIKAKDFARSTEVWIAKNVDAGTFEQLRPRIFRINALYEDVQQGDRYALTYIPGRGTELALNGTTKGIIEGEDFASAMFSIWIGPEPLDRSMKSMLLGEQ